jgi:hypothetical protein
MVDIQAGSEQVRRPLRPRRRGAGHARGGGDDLQARADATFAWQDELLDELG